MDRGETDEAWITPSLDEAAILLSLGFEVGARYSFEDQFTYVVEREDCSNVCQLLLGNFQMKHAAIDPAIHMASKEHLAKTAQLAVNSGNNYFRQYNNII